ncbi:11144_t:CDS:1, partial [Paraglomus brasilianum]
MGSDSDHRALILQAQTKHKSNIWRMNTAMLTNPATSNKLEQNIQTALPTLSTQTWDDLKSQIRITCREMGKVQAKKCRDGIINLTNHIKKLQSLSSPNTHIIANLTRKLKTLEETASKAYAIRSRVRWYEEGETSSKYFYQHFKYKQQKSSISSLQIPTTIPPRIP